MSDMLSFRYYWFSSVPYELIDNPLKGIYFQRYSYHRFQTSFLCPHVTEVWNSHSTNLVLSSYSLNLAVQSCSIVFEQLSAFLPCCVPVSAFAFRLGRLFPVLSYGVVPFFCPPFFNLLLTFVPLDARYRRGLHTNQRYR